MQLEKVSDDDDYEWYHALRDARREKKDKMIDAIPSKIEQLEEKGYKVQEFTEYHYRINGKYGIGMGGRRERVRPLNSLKRVL